jgi:dCMP deaminase
MEKKMTVEIAMARWQDSSEKLEAIMGRVWEEGRVYGSSPLGKETVTGLGKQPVRELFKGSGVTDRDFMLIAEAVAERAECDRRKVGAVIIDVAGEVVSVGWNRSSSRLISCNANCPRSRSSVEPGSDYDTAGPGRCIAVHAEAAAILACENRRRLIRGTIYTTAKPCYGCEKLIVFSKLDRSVFMNEGELQSVSYY